MLWIVLNRKKYTNELLISASKGSAIIYNGSLWHGSSRKIINKTRWALIYTYGRWFLKTSFDFNKNMPREIYEQLSERQKELLGYKFNPPIDEFTRLSSHSLEFEKPIDYQLPI